MRQRERELKLRRETARTLARRQKFSRKKRQSWLDVLRSLGFTSYDDYIRSPLWLAIRLRVYAAKGRSCVKCGGQSEQVHHARYDKATLTGESIEFLHPVCPTCHRDSEDRPPRLNEARGKLERANDRLGVPSWHTNKRSPWSMPVLTIFQRSEWQ